MTLIIHFSTGAGQSSATVDTTCGLTLSTWASSEQQTVWPTGKTTPDENDLGFTLDLSKVTCKKCKEKR
ncbi:MAG TPA: hypothetical protein VJJ22_03370 [Candidatus Paceibacterota bacterium]